MELEYHLQVQIGLGEAVDGGLRERERWARHGWKYHVLRWEQWKVLPFCFVLFRGIRDQ